MRSTLAGILVIVTVALAPAVAHAQTTSVGPYYATPSWDQQLPGATRFVVLSNWVDAAHPSGGAAVLDRETGLVWQRSPSQPDIVWLDALDYCNQLTAGGRLGWKLPSIQELNTLNDPTVTTFPFLPAGHPFTFTGALAFWASTTSAFSSADAWVGNFVIGILPRAFVQGKDGTAAGAWCVRGGAGTEVQ